jgi:hypothetical protein
MILQHEELLFEGVLSLHPVLVLDGFLPHAHELPSFKFLEKWQLLNMIVRVTLNQPLSERQELNRSVILIEGKTLARESVVLLLITSLVGGHQEIVGVLIGVRV